MLYESFFGARHSKVSVVYSVQCTSRLDTFLFKLIERNFLFILQFANLIPCSKHILWLCLLCFTCDAKIKKEQPTGNLKHHRKGS